MTSFVHDMPFGANLQPDGTVRFRLWAPGQDRISLAIEQRETLPMERQEDGWFALTTDLASAGSRYAFQLADGMHVPDPASRQQAEDVHGPTVVIVPLS